MDIPGSVCARTCVLLVPVHVDSPVTTAAAPCDADVMPRSIIGEGRLVRQVLPTDDERQKDAFPHVHLAPQLELVGEDGCSVGEDGGHLIPLCVPLHSNTHTDGRQCSEGHVDTGEALARVLWEI